MARKVDANQSDLFESESGADDRTVLELAGAYLRGVALQLAEAGTACIDLGVEAGVRGHRVSAVVMWAREVIAEGGERYERSRWMGAGGGEALRWGYSRWRRPRARPGAERGSATRRTSIWESSRASGARLRSPN